MNRAQWYTWGIGLVALGIIVLWFGEMMSCVSLRDDLLIACYIRRYAYCIPAIFSFAIGVIFFLCASSEPKKK